MTIKDQIKDRINAAENYLSDKRDYWTEYENLFHSKLQDAISDSTKSRVFDNKLGTFILEREYRVMSQMMAGKVKAISKNDEGASQLMNLILDKYILPNANAQFSFLTKSRMADRYSNVYGNFFTMIDWDVRKNGYVGPDMWLLNIRDVYPQVGAVSIEDSDYIIVRTWKPMSFFENLGKGYKNADKIVEKLKDLDGDKSRRESKDISAREDNQYPTHQAAKNKGFFEVYTQFEKDRWVDYVPDADETLRDIKNPHENDEIPIVCKYSIPLLDDFMGFGDFERGKTMQYAVNSLWNMYLDSQKMSIFPPILLNKDQIADPKSIKLGPAQKWIVRGQLDNVARPLNLTPQSMNYFNNGYNVLNSALLNMFGTTTTQTTKEVAPEFGKTPQALQMQAQRENARDAADRYYMEEFLTKVVKKMINLFAKKQDGTVAIRMFKEEIDNLKRTYPEVQEMYNEKTGKLTINKKNVGSIVYDYEIIPGSTFMVDSSKQQQNLQMMLDLFIKNPQLLQMLGQEGYTFKFGETVKRMFANSGIQDFDKMLVEKTEDEMTEEVLGADQQKFQQALMQMTGGVGNIPPMPGQAPMPEQV